MKAIFKLALAVSVVTTASAQPHAHGHHHGRRQVPSRVEKRIPDRATTWVDTIETEYRLIDGEEISPEDAAKGIADGLYIVVGSSTPAPAANDDDDDDDSEATKSVSAGNFIEHQTSSASSSTKTAAPTAQADSSSSSASVSSTGSGVDSEFPDGEISCSSFPDSYGAVAADWLGLSQWTGIQKVPNYSPGDSSIDYIETGVSGGCTANSFCSYRCPEGYEKSQWPEAQGATGQSIGGLYCNSDGKLELSRPSIKTLCTAGEGGVTISNRLSQSVAVCRTDYPGTESMTIPVDCSAGGTNTVTNPNQETYKWGGKLTSAQYYINPKGVSVADACLWTSPTNPSDAGNWAPIVLGVGKNNGITYIGLFPNTPTSTAPLDFNVKITGGSTECKYENGAFAGSSNGCTAAFTDSQEASIVFY